MFCMSHSSGGGGLFQWVAIASVLLLLSSGVEAQQCPVGSFYQVNTAAPIGFTGFNRDIIVENQPVSIPSTVTATQGGGDGPGGATWFQGPGGLPFDLQTPNGGPPFQLASPIGNNAVYLDPIASTTQTLTMATPSFLTSITVYGASQGGGLANPVVSLILHGSGGYTSAARTFQLGPWDSASPLVAQNTVALTQTNDFVTTASGGGIDMQAGTRYLFAVTIAITDTVQISDMEFALVGEQMAGLVMIMAVSGITAQCSGCETAIPGCASALACTSAADATCLGCRDGFIYNQNANNCTGIPCGVPDQLFRYRKLNIGDCGSVTTEQTCNLGCVTGYAADDVSTTAATCVATTTTTVTLDWTVFNCVDINECSLAPPVCGDGWVCGNTLGSFTCTPLAPSLTYIRECSTNTENKKSHRKPRRRGHGEGEGEGDKEKQIEYKWESKDGGRYYSGEGEAEGTHDRIPKARSPTSWREEGQQASELCIGLEWAALGAPHVVIKRAFLHVASSSRSWELNDIANPDYTTTVVVNGLKRGTTYSFTLVAETSDGVVHRGLPFKLTTPSVGSIY